MDGKVPLEYSLSLALCLSVSLSVCVSVSLPPGVYFWQVWAFCSVQNLVSVLRACQNPLSLSVSVCLSVFHTPSSPHPLHEDLETVSRNVSTGQAETSHVVCFIWRHLLPRKHSLKADPLWVSQCHCKHAIGLPVYCGTYVCSIRSWRLIVCNLCHWAVSMVTGLCDVNITPDDVNTRWCVYVDVSGQSTAQRFVTNSAVFSFCLFRQADVRRSSCLHPSTIRSQE